jgi:hypothetical protein
MRHHVRITADGRRGTVQVDGHEIGHSVTDLEFHAGVDDAPTLVLELRLFTGDVDAQGTKVYLPDTTRAALVALGWTPPADETEAIR